MNMETNTNRGTRLIELNHTIEDGMVTYKGLPAPVIRDHLSRVQSRQLYAEGTEFQIGKITLVANTGTYIDAPAQTADGCYSSLESSGGRKNSSPTGLLARISSRVSPCNSCGNTSH